MQANQGEPATEETGVILRESSFEAMILFPPLPLFTVYHTLFFYACLLQNEIGSMVSKCCLIGDSSGGMMRGIEQITHVPFFKPKIPLFLLTSRYAQANLLRRSLQGSQRCEQSEAVTNRHAE